MKYLNERITQQIDLSSVQTRGMYKYEVQVRELAHQNEWYTVFVGNYYNQGTRWYTFDITDICRSRKRNPHTSYGNVFDVDVNVVGLYRIVVSKDDGTTVTTPEINVAHIYPYPNVKNSRLLLDPTTSFFDQTDGTKKDVSVLLQGNHRSRTGLNNLYLVPRYPIVNDSQDLDYNTTMTFGLTIETGIAQTYVTVFSVNAGEDPTVEDNWLGSYELDHLTYDNFSHTFFKSYAYFVSSQHGDLSLNTDIWIYIRWQNINNVYQYRRIAIIEACKSRYYLLWQDRFGSYQSQPFNGKLEYSEDIVNSEFTNYRDKRFKNVSTVQPKWKINSGWLKEELFPFYESIYVSPILRLYDTETQTEYDVILNDNYVEKKYENNKQLLSIELKLESSEKQNITY